MNSLYELRAQIVKSTLKVLNEIYLKVIFSPNAFRNIKSYFITYFNKITKKL